MNRICVFCGSSAGSSPVYAQTATELGRHLADLGIGVVFGGSALGLMGEVSNAALAAGGEVIGVIPQALERREIAHQGLTDLRVVNSMHERKALMVELSDGFIALPGGLGTLDELFEILTWAQLGIHAKPCALLNVDSFFDPLLQHLDLAVEKQFVRPQHREMILEESDVETLLAKMQNYVAPSTRKWIDGPQP